MYSRYQSVLPQDPTVQRFKRSSDPRERVAEKVRSDDETTEHDRGSPIECIQCGRIVTDSGARISIEGKHEHVCVNPHGIAFNIGCFESAPGCVGQGEASNFWSWFTGYSWQIALCSGCSLHIGWLFRGAEGGFYGLILARLHESPESP